MAPVTGARSGLRTRCSKDTRSLELLSNKERGLRAAKQVLVDGERTLSKTIKHWGVSYSTVDYYKRKLIASGYAELLEAAAAAARASEAVTTQQHKRKKCTAPDTAAAWDTYGKAYIWAGERVAKVGQRKAAVEAQKKFEVTISSSTAWRASKNPGKPPTKPGREPYLGAEAEHQLSASEVILASLTRMLLGILFTLCRLIIVAQTYERCMISIPERFDPGSRAQSRFS